MLHENKSTEAERFFLLSLFARIASALLTSKFFLPCVHWYVKIALTQALASQEFTPMLQLLKFAFRVSLYLLKGLPWSRCSSFSCPYSTIFEILSSSIRTMCPVHLSWHLMIEHSMLRRPHFSKTWRLDTLSCHLMLQILPKISLVKLLQMLDVPSVGSPRLAAIQKRAQDHSSVYRNLGGEADAVVLPKSLCQSTEGTTCLSKALHHLSVQGSTARNGATQIAELVHSLDLYVVDDDGRRWWCIGSL